MNGDSVEGINITGLFLVSSDLVLETQGGREKALGGKKKGGPVQERLGASMMAKI